MTNLEIRQKAIEDYNIAFADSTYVDKEQAAYNCLVNRVTAEIWKQYGATCAAEAAEIKGISKDISLLLAFCRRELGIEGR